MKDNAEDDNWLQRYLADAIKRNLCTRIRCTTCGTMEFWDGLLAATVAGQRDAAERGPVLARGRGGPEALTALLAATALALPHVKPEPGVEGRYTEAVRLILYNFWSLAGSSRFDRELAPALRGTWSGQVLVSMAAHHASRVAAHQTREAFEGQRREQRERRRQEHEERATRNK